MLQVYRKESMLYWNGDLDYWCADIETTGLLQDLAEQENPKMHNFCAKNIITNEVVYFTGEQSEEIQEFISKPRKYAIHNGVCYDKEALKFFGYDVSNMVVVDTLALSYYLYPTRDKHGLDAWGRSLGIEKPKIDNWENLTAEEYKHRVMEDVKIQEAVTKHLLKYLTMIYYENDNRSEEGDVKINQILQYLCWKMEELSQQERTNFRLDVEGAEKLLEKLTCEIENKTEELRSAMPKVAKKSVKKRPKTMFKASGGFSLAWEGWVKLCAENGVEETVSEVSFISSYADPNPASVSQIKDWLYSLGWTPSTFKYSRDKEGNEKSIPQIYKGEGKICDSIKVLIEDHPELSALEGLGLIKHRQAMVKGFLSNSRGGRITASSHGFTNTLRMRHVAPLANIPSLRVAYGGEVRGLLQSNEDEVLLGSDLCSLEDRIKHHFQWKLDPEYVKTQQTKGFDPHLYIACLGNFMTEDEMNFYKWYKENHG